MLRNLGVVILWILLLGIHPFSASAQAENQALQLNGLEHDYISIANLPSLGSMVHEFTWEARIKPHGDRAYQSILEWGNSLETVGVHFYVHEGDGLFAHLVGAIPGPNLGADPIIQVADVLTIGEWQDVILVYDGSEARLYVDGELVAQESMSGAVKTAAELLIGQRFFMQDMGFDGEIDEIRLWNKVLEVEEFGMGLPSAQSSLVARYTFDQADGTDWTGHGHDGELIGDAAMANGTFHLDGSGNTYMQLANEHGGGRLELESMRQQLTWEARLRTSDARPFQAILEWGDPHENIGVHFYVNSGNDLFAHLVGATLDRDPGENPIIRASNALTSGKWHDVALTYNGTEARLYVDGEKKAEEAMHGILDTESQLLIGRRLPTPGFSFYGAIDEIRLWNRALNVDELSADLSGNETGLVARYTFDSGTAEDASGNGHDGHVLGNPEWIIVEESVADLVVDIPGGDKIEFMWIEPDGGNVAEGFYLSKYEVTYRQLGVTLHSNDPYPYHPQEHDPDYPLPTSWHTAHGPIHMLNEAAGDSLFRLPTAAEWQHACRSGLLGDEDSQLDTYAWHMGNSPSEIHRVGTRKPNSLGLYDMLGNAAEWVQDFEYQILNDTNHGSLWVGLPSNGQGYNTELGYLLVDSTPALEETRTAMTWEAWIKAGAGEPYQAILEWGDEYHVGGHLYVKNGTRVYANLYTSNGDHQLETEDIPVAGEFIHVALTYDGTTGILYVNGKEEERMAVTGELEGGKHLIIGARLEQGGKFGFHGQIDEVRIWAEARNEKAIAECMGHNIIADEGKLVAYYTFDEVGADVAIDHSGHGHDAGRYDAAFMEYPGAPVQPVTTRRYLEGGSTHINGTPSCNWHTTAVQEGPSLSLRLLRMNK